MQLHIRKKKYVCCCNTHGTVQECHIFNNGADFILGRKASTVVDIEPFFSLMKCKIGDSFSCLGFLKLCQHTLH